MTSAVMMQYSRDLKGHLASLFLNENINLGKKYVFDIKRTSKEVYDHARRALYNAGVVDLVSRSDHSPPNSPLKSSESSMNCASCEGLSCQQTRALQEKLRKLKEAMLCMVCCEEEINSAFCPCGHTVCCEGCAAQLQVRGARRQLISRRQGHTSHRSQLMSTCCVPRASRNARLHLGRVFVLGDFKNIALGKHSGLASCFQPCNCSKL